MKTMTVDQLKVYISESRDAMGKLAASHAAQAINAVLEKKETANVIFAAAPSQNETLFYLLQENVDFTRINAFHMDEYVDLPAGAPQTFASYLTEHIFSKAPFRSVHLIASDMDGDDACLAYEKLLKENPPDVVCLGIGENGHIAFNDPDFADFNDPKVIKPVALDEICRMQQVHDGCFPSLDKVPTHALTLTVPTLLSARYLICTVPAITKADAVKVMVTGAIGEYCPATSLRNHEGAELFLDPDSASKLD